MQETRHMHAECGVRLERIASMHHVGQGYEIRVPLPDGPVDPDYEVAMLHAFHEAYRREYGYNDPDSAVEVTDWYLVATFAGSRAGQQLRLRGAAEKRAPLRDERPMYLPEANGLLPCKVLDRYAMTAGEQFEGPLLIEEPECTTLVLPGDTVRVSGAGNLVISVRGAP